ncbi:hypothetical protein ACF068_14670 [Streptomyces sp. NPDC016309]|uniref:hypothetical protein n=1 Tax=Streptomyces sp. NPDC016309 TaxID=3364965 RepID=UPI0036F6F9F6
MPEQTTAVGNCPCGSCRTPCFAQPATCPTHGPKCEPDDHIEPPTVHGEAS